MKRYPIILIIILMTLFSCQKEEHIIIEEVILGDWDVVEYASYKEGEEVNFVKGEPYWQLLRYAQGISIVRDGYYYRYGPLEEINETNFQEKGGWNITKDLKKITFSIPDVQNPQPYQLQAEIISLNKSRMWIKYTENGMTAEYIYQKK